MARAVLPIGLCRGNQTSLLASAMHGQNHCVPLDFCHRSWSVLALPDIELQPFLQDLRLWFGVRSDAAWNKCLEITPGQPFRLHLLRILAEISKDPDSAFTDQLCAGVSLGVRSQLQPCAVVAPVCHLILIRVPWSAVPLLGSLLCLTCLRLMTLCARSCIRDGLERFSEACRRCVSSVASVLPAQTWPSPSSWQTAASGC